MESTALVWEKRKFLLRVSHAVPTQECGCRGGMCFTPHVILPESISLVSSLVLHYGRLLTDVVNNKVNLFIIIFFISKGEELSIYQKRSHVEIPAYLGDSPDMQENIQL